MYYPTFLFPQNSDLSCDICTHFAHYLYSRKQSWIINTCNETLRKENQVKVFLVVLYTCTCTLQLYYTLIKKLTLILSGLSLATQSGLFIELILAELQFSSQYSTSTHCKKTKYVTVKLSGHANCTYIPQSSFTS